MPMWVADMDFASPPEVLAALHARVDHGIFGYTDPPASLTEAVLEFLLRRHRWTVDADWLVWLPGLVQGLNLACRAVGRPGDEIITAIPVYPPFLGAPSNGGRRLVTVPLVESERRWGWDFDRLDAACGPRTRLLLLCHPHNPVGRVWREDELRTLIDMAKRHDLIVCSDEIHCDLVLDADLKHMPLALVDPDFAERTITLLAPSKTWNLAGLGCSFAVIPNANLRRGFVRSMAGLVPSVNLLGFTAAEAAYRHGRDWHERLIDYLRANRDLLIAWMAENGRLRAAVPEATYLAWIDARAVDAEDPLPAFEAIGVGLSDGRQFGSPGFLRLNFGCPRATLHEALRRLERLP